MNASTPAGIITSPKTGEEKATIAVAIFIGPETCDEISHGLLQNALSAGLRRKDIEDGANQHFYFEHFSLRLISVKWIMRGQATASIKETLAELTFQDHAIIALNTADSVWNVIHGNKNLWSWIGWAFLYNRNRDSVFEAQARERYARFVEWRETGRIDYLKDLSQRALKEQSENPHPNE